MEEPISITWLNDFIFCPASIYFHNLYGTVSSVSFQDVSQINGSSAHRRLDSGKYSTRKTLLSGISVYSEKYNLIGKIDLYDADRHELIERKKRIRTVYDGYVFQLYAQYYAITEMGYAVQKLTLHSLDDNKSYPVPLPEEDSGMREKFFSALSGIQSLDLQHFRQENTQKCAHCIYEPLCDSSLLQGDENHAQRR